MDSHSHVYIYMPPINISVLCTVNANYLLNAAQHVQKPPIHSCLSHWYYSQVASGSIHCAYQCPCTTAKLPSYCASIQMDLDSAKSRQCCPSFPILYSYLGNVTLGTSV